VVARDIGGRNPKESRSPDRFDGQVVTLRGTVIALRVRLSRIGNDYYTFTLRPGSQGPAVFSFGQPPCPEGAPVIVEGVLQKVKHQGQYTLRNQVNAHSIACR
jgi:hypothetical protein